MQMLIRRLKRHRLGVAVCLLLGMLLHPHLQADELVLPAKVLFERGVTQQLLLVDEGISVELARGVLIEDDGPAAGYSYQPNVEKLTPEVFIKKELVIPAPQAERVTLLIARGGDITARINGQHVPLESLGKQGNYWQVYQFSPDVLRSGANDVVLTGTGSVWIAREDEFAPGSLTRTTHPNRSAKSIDGGKTWNDSQLGTANNIDGEYCIRLFLDQFLPSGQLRTHVIDVGNLAEQPIGPPVMELGTIQIAARVTSTFGSKVTLLARTGSTFVPNDNDWSDWSALGASEGEITNPVGRFLQLDFQFATENPLQTPGLKNVTVRASPRRRSDWTKGLKILEIDNDPLVRSSIPFQYEPFDRPELAELRKRHHLDAVVAGSKTEFELMQRLAVWSATRWEKMHLKDGYPAFNAVEILKPHPDGTPIGGFCQQYNLVFLQACESFGFVGRLVSIGQGIHIDKFRSGHETVEIWSNEFRKWIYIDGNTAWYAIDATTKVPLSLWELRQRQLAEFNDQSYPPLEVVVLTETKYQWPDLRHGFPFLELRLIPRSNFLEQERPMPLNQGMRGWFWTGHYVWDDEKEPARLLYSHRVNKRENFEWSVNRAHLVFEAMKPGTVRVHIDSQTPGLKNFLCRTNKDSTTTAATFDWKLLEGQNRLQVVPKNIAGRDGVPTQISLNWSR